MPVEGRWVDRVVGLDGVRVDIAMMRTPDGHGRLELMKFPRPPSKPMAPSIMFAVEDIEDVSYRLWRIVSVCSPYSGWGHGPGLERCQDLEFR